ncbi:MAG TPA: ATP-dependent helicase [Candidatus Dormibacteraeota bacterium]|nr:ATP-dependent helicase [Candidatus Dormibacteraeota bacterium]
MRILERDLDNEQLAIAVKSPNHSLLVIAGPGSGKTRLLTHVAAYQVRRSHPATWRVLCLTFTVEAAREMRTRLSSRALEVPQRRRIEVANFHQLGMTLLGHHGHHIGWPRDAQVLDALEAQELAKEVADELGLHAITGRAALDAISRLRNNRAPDPAAGPAESLIALRAAYERRLDDLRLRDFDDLILDSIRLLDERPDVAAIVRSTYRYLLVDELQDTSGWQLEFVGRLSNEGETPIFAVADNDQMIYAWRDARAENIVEWEERFQGERVNLLGNYRCPPRIVEAANALISHNPGVDREAEPYSRVDDRPGNIFVIQTAGGGEEAATVVSIVRERREAGVAPDKIAVLASVGFLLKPSVEALAAGGIRVIWVGEDPSAGSDFARALRAALVLATTPEQERARARLQRLFADRLEVAELDAFVAELSAHRTIDGVIRRLADVAGLELDDADVVRARQVVALAERETGVEPPAMVGRRIALEWHRLSRQLQREAEAVKAMTTFVAKGLEFDTVVIPGFNQGLVPYVRSGMSLTQTVLLEKRREVYVAVTRAESHLYLMVRRDRAPSRFLDELGIRKDEHFSWS